MDKKLIKPIAYLATGILTFIFMALDYFKAVLKYGDESESEGISAFKYMKEDFTGADAEILYTLSSIALIGVIIAAVALILVGVAKLLPALGVKVEALEKQSDLIDKVAGIASKLILVLSVVAFVLTLIFGTANSEKVEYYNFVVKTTLSPALGAYLVLVASFIPGYASKYLKKHETVEAAPQETPSEEA